MTTANTNLSPLLASVAASHALLGRWRTALIAAVAAAQALVLVSMVWDREALLANGRQVTMDVRPVDPRSLFRGDYVILSYDISRLPLSMFPSHPRTDQRVLVRLVQDAAAGAGGWKPVGVTLAMPERITDSEVVLAGHVRYAPPQTSTSARGSDNTEQMVLMTYGIESFFVPEGAGKPIELEIAPGKVKVELAVSASGEAAIKALLVDGERVGAEPLF
ncbi:MAG: GDYXXLXY domain-containing protein [Hyphomicrobiaceae bacterium]